MPLVMNGVVIPEDTANALTFNGVDITDVFLNGTQIWEQSLFSATWSGNSLTSINSIGIGTSGSNYRFQYSSFMGQWLTATSSGLADGYSALDGTGSQISSGIGAGFSCSNNSLRSVQADWHGYVFFDLYAKFTGTAVGGSDDKEYQTSGGAIRFVNSVANPSGWTGDWITLT